MDKVKLVLLLFVLAASSSGDEEDSAPITKTWEGDSAPIIKTSSGEISGLKEESTKGNVFYSYYGIPFAKPPVGDLRFKNPSKIDGWEGVRDCTKWPKRCPQFGMLFMDPGLTGDEDCLYLNIFTPRPLEEHLHLPVMVFIHGGAFTAGSSQDYAPYVMMNHEIVFVTIQYRLGMLGFLSTEDDEAPGNFGLKDQTMAMSWVQNNIHMFGGDSIGITLFGESAGASSVHFQILSPRSVGLFQRAILMSGTVLAPFAFGGAFKEVAEYTGKFFNCTTGEGSKELINCLQKVPVEDLVPVQQHFNEWFINPFLFAPRVDGDFVIRDPEYLLKENRHKKMDLMCGVTSHEGGLYSLPLYANEAYRAALMLNFPEIGPVSLEFGEGDLETTKQTAMIYDYYLKGVNVDLLNADNITKMFSDRYFNIPHDVSTSFYAKNVARYKKKVFTYELTYKGQLSISDMFGKLDIGKEYVSHADDLFYLFNGGIWRELENENDLKMRDLMTTLWTNFAKHGDPTPDDTLGFKWEPINGDNLTHLNINLSPTMEADSRATVREFWLSLPLKQNLILYPEKVTNITVVPVEEGSGDSSSSEEETTAEANCHPPVVKEGISKESIAKNEDSKDPASVETEIPGVEKQDGKSSEKESTKKDEL